MPGGSAAGRGSRQEVYCCITPPGTESTHTPAFWANPTNWEFNSVMIEPYQFDARDRDAVYKIDTKIAIDAGCIFHQSRSFAVTTQWAIPKEAIVERRDLWTAGLMWENPVIVRQRENILATAATMPTPPSRPPPKAMPTAPRIAPMPTRPCPKPGRYHGTFADGMVAPTSEPPPARPKTPRWPPHVTLTK